MKSAMLVVLLVLSNFISSREVAAHEVRPAYLEIREIVPNRFNILWKQPSIGTRALYLKPILSNGLLDAPPDEEHVTANSVTRRWSGRSLARDHFNGTTLVIEGLERTITDVLLNITFANGQQIHSLIKPSKPSFVIHVNGTGNVPVAAYLSLGIKHILGGGDHLSFVLGLVMLVRGRLRLVKTVTAFTVGHSVTLGSAALGYVKVSAPLVEALVALSIVFVALELARSWDGCDGITTRYPWVIAASFGLLHGFAFAGSLADVGLPPGSIPVALLLFNCGVEFGQLMFVGAVFATTAVLRRRIQPIHAARARWLVPYAIGTLAAYWMFKRVIALIV